MYTIHVSMDTWIIETDTTSTLIRRLFAWLYYDCATWLGFDQIARLLCCSFDQPWKALFHFKGMLILESAIGCQFYHTIINNLLITNNNILNILALLIDQSIIN